MVHFIYLNTKIRYTQKIYFRPLLHHPLLSRHHQSSAGASSDVTIIVNKYLDTTQTEFWPQPGIKINQTFQEIESENLCQQKYEERLKEEDFGDSKYGIVRKYLWNLTEYPETSIAAQVAHITIS